MNLTFKTEHLTDKEKENLKKFVSDSIGKIGKMKRTNGQIFKRYIWLAKYRLGLEEGKKGGEK